MYMHAHARDMVTRMHASRMSSAPLLLLTREHPDSSAPFSRACDRPGSILTRAHVTCMRASIVTLIMSPDASQCNTDL